MKKEIIINSTISETRVAILENGKLAELFVERPEKERMVGNIYKGRVVNIVKAMNACFVDIGQEQNAFLRFSDMGSFFDEYTIPVELEGEPHGRRRRSLLLSPGQELLVQVIKEPMDSKGARATLELSLPGRFLVLVPNHEHVGVSRKIKDIREKRRLKKIASSIRPEGFGLIVRTVAEGKGEEAIKADLENLLAEWRKIEKRSSRQKTPSLVHKDVGVVSSVIRDFFTEDVDRVLVDSRKVYQEIVSYLKDVSPSLIPRVELYKGKKPIFDEFHLEEEIEKCLSRKIWTKSGGYIVFDHTEALVAVDINSGKFIRSEHPEQNALRINLEAVREIARQIRLRDIGGLIVIDLIDMTEERNKQRVYNELRKELRKDRAKTSVCPVSNFGLIEMTREKVRPSLIFTFSEPCPTCGGLGRIPSKATIATKIEQWIKRFKTESRERSLKLVVHPEMAKYLTQGFRSKIRRMMLKFLVRIQVVADESLSFDEFIFYSKKNGENITDRFIT